MLVSTKGRYALHIMINLALDTTGEPVSLKDISEKEHISMKYLESIMHNLVKVGLVQSFRGKTGGYKLVKTSNEYNVLEIIQAVEKGPAISQCSYGDAVCSKKNVCLSNPVWTNLDRIVKQHLESIILADIIEKKEKND